MSIEQSKVDSPAKLAEDDGLVENVLANRLKTSGDDTSDDSASSIAEEIGDNDNDTVNDDEIDNIMERDQKLERIPSAESKNVASSSGSQSSSTTTSSSSSTTTTVPPQSNIAKADDAMQIKAKSVGTSRPKGKMDAKQKATVIKAKTASSVNSNNKLKLAKTIGKQVSTLQTDGGKEKRPQSSPSGSVDGGAAKSKSHEMKSAYAPPPASPKNSPTASGFNTLKADLPGRVSFSKNDVYEIDYSDIENDTDTSRSLDFNEPFRKKNVHFEDEYFDEDDDDDDDGHMDDTVDTAAAAATVDVKNHSTFAQVSMHRNLSTAKEISESSNLLTEDKEYCPLKCSSLRCKADMRLDVLPEDNENGSTIQPSDSSEKIIEEYKREIESINRQHELERRWNESKKINGDATATYSDYLNGSPARSERKESEKMPKDEWQSGGSDSWSSPNHEPTANLVSKTKVTNTNASTTATAATTTATTATSNTSDESPTRDSASTVINNYLKITNQKSIGSTSKPSSATIKLKTTTKKPAIPSNRKIKSAQVTGNATTTNRLTKAKSVGHLQRVTDIKLNEFQIDKVESWMSTHEDTFSDTGLNSYRRYGKFGSSSNLDYKKTWRETPTSKTDDEGNYSLDDQVDNTSMDGSIGGGIELVLKKLEGRRMQISFGRLFRAIFDFLFGRYLSVCLSHLSFSNDLDPIKSATSAPSLSANSESFQQKSCSVALSTNSNEHSNKIK